jgi:hypothetical protein
MQLVVDVAIKFPECAGHCPGSRFPRARVREGRLVCAVCAIQSIPTFRLTADRRIWTGGKEFRRA